MHRLRFRPVSLALVICAMVPAVASAQQAPPASEPARQPSGAQRIVVDQLGGSINEPGLQNSLELIWTRPLSSSNRPLLADAHLALGLVSVVTPAAARVGGWIEFSPLSIIDIRAGVEPGVYFGTFNSVSSFASYGDRFDRKTRDARTDNTFATGLRAYVEPAVKMKVGPLVARVGAEFERWSSSAAGPFFYEPTRDTLMKTNGDYVMTLTSVAIYQQADASGGLVGAGVIHNLTHVFDAPAGNRSERIGLIGFREFGSPRFRLPHLRVTALVWRYLKDPSKRDQWGAALAIGFRTGK